jgi:hypothetical protein
VVLNRNFASPSTVRSLFAPSLLHRYVVHISLLDYLVYWSLESEAPLNLVPKLLIALGVEKIVTDVDPC